MPWVQLDNVVVGALIGLGGIVCGNLISGWSQRRVEHERSRLAELTLAFDSMKTELERLTLKVDRLEKDLEAGLNAPFGARCFMTCSRCVILAGRFYRS